MVDRLGLLVPDEEKTDEEKLAELVATTQPQAFPGFIQKGTPEAPYYEPDPEFRPPLVEAPPVPITSFGPEDVPITPQVQTQTEGAAQKEELTRNVTESLDPFAIAAQRTRQSVRPELGRQQSVPNALEVLDNLAKGAFEEAGKATAGEEFDPQKVFDPAQLAVPGKAALLVGGGMIASNLAAKKLQEQGGLQPTAEDLAKLLIPSAGAAEMTDKERLIAAARARLAPDQQPQEQVPTVENAPVNAPKLPRKPAQRSKESPEDYAKRLADYEAEKEKYYSTYTPTAQRIINTVGGPKVIKDTDYAGLGWAAAIGAGMILGPRVLRAFKWGVTPRPRSIMDALTLKEGVFGEQRIPVGREVVHAMPGTRAFSNPMDLARTADDINKAILNVGAKNGIMPEVEKHLNDLFGVYTRSGARYLAEGATETGKMRTNTFTFNAPVSIAQMQQRFTPDMKQYLVALDTFENLVARSRLPQYKSTAANPNPGLPVAGGHTWQTLGPIIRSMEQANPAVKDAAEALKQWNRSIRQFQSTGEYATIPAKRPPTNNPGIPDRSAEYLNAYRKYEVPWLERQESRGMDLTQRVSEQDPVQMLSTYSKQNLRERLENEAIGQYVDNMRKAVTGSFVRVGRTPEEVSKVLAEHPEYIKNTVSFYRRGVKESYTTDPFLASALKMDLPSMTGPGDFIYATKRAIEWGATGLGAPAFAPISLLRNWQIGKQSAERGFWTPTLMGSLRAVPQQLYPQLAKAIHESIDAGALSRFAGAGWVDSLSKTLAKHYDDSLYAQLKSVGSARGSILEHERMSNGIQQMQKKLDEWTGPAKPYVMPWLNGYKELIQSIHNGPAFDYVRRNLHTIDPNTGKTVTLPTMALKARRLTGDPRTSGQYYFKDAQGVNRPIQYETGGSLIHAAADLAIRPYLLANEWLGRGATPWFNATQQGIKGIGQAYLRDPALFTRNMWLYSAMPSAALYLYSHALGKDPNGQSYVDYERDRRTAYNRQMNWYIPLPGLPAEQGIELPGYHELAPVKRMTTAAMDHMFGNAQNSLREEYWKAAHAFVDTAIIPPVPPLVGAPMALFGIQPPMGVFGGDAYQIKSDPFDQWRGMPANIEAFTRVLGGSMAQVIGSGYAAYSHTPEGFTDGVMSGVKAGGRTLVEKAPIVRDITRILPTMSGNTDIRKDLFDNQKEIDQLLKFIQADRGAGIINVTPASQGGGNVATQLLGPAQSSESPGLAPKPPTNPLYLQFMDDLYNRFKRESPTYVKGEDQGGIGIRSLWRRYGDATAALKSLRNVDEGNYVTWQKELEGRKDVTEELKRNNVNPTNLREVKNYYVYKQQDAAAVILKTIHAVEQEFSEKAGRPIKLKNIQPYAQPITGDAPFSYPEVVEQSQGVVQP